MEIIKNLKGEEEEHEHEESSNTLSTIPLMYDILFEIFSFLPLNSVLKFKSVSKTIQDLTLHPHFIRKQFDNFKPTLTGLFYQTKTDLSNVEFLPTRSEVDLPNPNLDFLKQKNKNEKQKAKQREVLEIRVIDSCNGLLLCSTVTGTTNAVTTIYVYNPLTKEKLQLPHPKRRSGSLHYAILTDFIGFRVACLRRAKKGFYETELIIYSSETGQWEEKEEKLPGLSHELVMGLWVMGRKAFFNGSLFWDCFDNHILVLPMNAANCYELIEAPRAAFYRCLFKFDQKLVCYCFTNDDDFPAWYFNTDVNLASTMKGKKNKLPHWKAEDGGLFKTLSEAVSSPYKDFFQGVLLMFTIIAYDHKSCTMYLSVGNSIYSYQLENRSLDLMVGGNVYERWNSKTNVVSVVPYVHTLAKIQMGNVAEHVKRKQEETEEEETEGDDLVDETASSTRKKGRKMKRQRKKRNNLADFENKFMKGIAEIKKLIAQLKLQEQ